MYCKCFGLTRGHRRCISFIIFWIWKKNGNYWLTLLSKHAISTDYIALPSLFLTENPVLVLQNSLYKGQRQHMFVGQRSGWRLSLLRETQIRADHYTHPRVPCLSVRLQSCPWILFHTPVYHDKHITIKLQLSYTRGWNLGWPSWITNMVTR